VHYFSLHMRSYGQRSCINRRNTPMGWKVSFTGTAKQEQQEVWRFIVIWMSSHQESKIVVWRKFKYFFNFVAKGAMRCLFTGNWLLKVWDMSHLNVSSFTQTFVIIVYLILWGCCSKQGF
jgi:hypothetical protein